MLLAVVAEDGCGTWIEWTKEVDSERTKWTICLSPVLNGGSQIASGRQVRFAVRQRNQEPAQAVSVTTIAADRWVFPLSRSADGTFVSRLSAFAKSDKEDVQLPIGLFLSAAKITQSEDTVWVHADVPLSGVLRAKDSMGMTELVSYGIHGEAVNMTQFSASPSRDMRRSNLFSSFSFGVSRLTGYATEDSATGLSGMLEIGLQISSHADLSVEAGFTTGLEFSPDPTMSQETSLLVASARWRPLSSRVGSASGFDEAALYLKAGLGYSELFRKSTFDVRRIAHGFVVAAALGWTPIRGRDWSLGLEIADKSILYHGNGLRHDVMLLMVTQLVWRN
jgi:hypothetical protein